MRVCHLYKNLSVQETLPMIEGIRLRHFVYPDDVFNWLELRSVAFANESPSSSTWTKDDFAREMVCQQWWNASHTLLAEETLEGKLVGSVFLAVRNRGEQLIPSAHWLMVHPYWRTKGIGRLLMTQMERIAHEDGYRELQVETHSSWRSAMTLYHHLGYQPL